MKKDRREEFEWWYDQRLKSKEQFDYFHEIVTYCSQDVNILRLSVMKFRKVMIEIAKVDTYVRCLTLAHLCSVVFRKLYLPQNTLAIISHDGFKHAKRYSVKAIKFLEYVMHTNPGLIIQHQLNGAEKKVLDKYHVDGFISFLKEREGEVYEFAGCFYHGHPCKF